MSPPDYSTAKQNILLTTKRTNRPVEAPQMSPDCSTAKHSILLATK